MRSTWRFVLRRGRLSPIGAKISSPADRVSENFPAYPRSCNFRCFSSETAAIEVKGSDYSVLAGIFSAKSNSDDVEAQLSSAGIKIDHGALNSALDNLGESPDVARRVFYWFSEKKPEIISSTTFNAMLGILGSEGKTSEFWEMLELMKKKGYCLSKNAFLKASKGFEGKDLGILRGIYAANSPENYVSRMVPRMCKVLREGDELGTEVWKELQTLEAEYSSELVASVLDKLSSYPAKALLFFRWVTDNSTFKPDHRSYNAMARVLGREDCIEEFWNVIKEMRENGHGLDSETYLLVSKRFLSRRMAKEAVDLYEFAMAEEERPSHENFLYLLRKIVSSEELELPLVSRVVKIFKDTGDPIEDSTFSSLLKSLTSVGKGGECLNLLKVMEEGGFSGGSALYARVAVELCKSRKPDEASAFMMEKENSGIKFEPKIWAFVIRSLALSGSLEKSLSCFNALIKRHGGERNEYSFDALVTAYIRKNKVLDAYALFPMVEKHQLRPWQTTYKVLIKGLLHKGKLKEASKLLGLMKKHGYPPYIEPFFGYIAKFGNGEDAMMFLTSMTVKSFPSISVFLRLMEAILKAGRREVADDLLSRTPGYARNHADVLNLVYSFKSSPEKPNVEAVPA